MESTTWFSYHHCLSGTLTAVCPICNHRFHNNYPAICLHDNYSKLSSQRALVYLATKTTVLSATISMGLWNLYCNAIIVTLLLMASQAALLLDQALHFMTNNSEVISWHLWYSHVSSCNNRWLHRTYLLLEDSVIASASRQYLAK